MALKDCLLGGLDNDMENSRKVLERVPEDKFGWKPHPKSGTMIWLAGHVAYLAGWEGSRSRAMSSTLCPVGNPWIPRRRPKTGRS